MVLDDRSVFKMSCLSFILIILQLVLAILVDDIGSYDLFSYVAILLTTCFLGSSIYLWVKHLRIEMRQSENLTVRLYLLMVFTLFYALYLEFTEQKSKTWAR